MGFVELVGESVVIKESVKVWPCKSSNKYADWTYRKYINRYRKVWKQITQCIFILTYQRLFKYATQRKVWVERHPTLEKSVWLSRNSSLNMSVQAGTGRLLQGHRLRRTLKLVPDSDMPTVLDAHGHLSVVLKCILHGLRNLRIRYSLSVGCAEHFHKFWHRFGRCTRKCNLNRFGCNLGHTPLSNARTGTLKNGHCGISVGPLTNSTTQTFCTRDVIQISVSSRVNCLILYVWAHVSLRRCE